MQCNTGKNGAGMRVLDSEYKLRQNIKIAMLYLEDDDSINAELFIKKASSLIAASKVCFCLSWLQNVPIAAVHFLIIIQRVVHFDVSEVSEYTVRSSAQPMQCQSRP